MPISDTGKALAPPVATTTPSPAPEEVVTGIPLVEPVVPEPGFPPIFDMAGGFNPANIVHSEERIEYRDQDGNLLNEEQVKALEGKVEFHTRYETRTKLLDVDGNEILQSGVPETVAGPLVDAVNPETVNVEKAEEGELKAREVEVFTESAASPASEEVAPESAVSEDAVVPESAAPESAAPEEVASEGVVAEKVAEVIPESVVSPEVHTETVVADQDGNTVEE